VADVYPAGARLPFVSGSRGASGGEAVLIAVLAIYIALITVWPFARLVYEALVPGRDGEILGALLGQWRSAAVLEALVNTIETSVLATLISVAIGIVIAFLLALTDVRGKAALTFIMLLPLLIPSQITALAWIELANVASPFLAPFGLAPEPGATNPLCSEWGIVLVMGIEHSTLVFLAVRARLRNLPRDLIEAACLNGARPLRVTGSLILPMALPAILAGAALAFIAAIGNFGVPALLGIPVRYGMLTTLIYHRLLAFEPRVLGEVAALALMLAALAGISLLLWALLVHRGRIVAAGERLEPFRLGRGRAVVAALLWIVLIGIAVLPLLALLAASLSPALSVPLRFDTATLDNYRVALLQQDATIRALRNSFALAGVAAMVAAMVAVPLAYLTMLRRNPLARALDVVAVASYAVPGTVLAVAVILVFLPPLPFTRISLSDTPGIILAAYLARFLALAARPTMAGMGLVDRNLDAAAEIAGASVHARLLAVIGPTVAASVAVGALLVFITALNELTMSVLLWSTGYETLGVVVFTLYDEGNLPAAAAVAAISVAITLALAGIACRLGRGLPEGAAPWRA
jgi:iron(III) transport system permease protein